MPCDTRLKSRQTISQRKEEVRKVQDRVSAGLAKNTVRAKIGPQGAITFTGLTDEERDGVTDACIYRRIMVSGSALARQKIAAAEQSAGRTVNRQTLAQGVHSHDGGNTWDNGH